MAQVKHYQAKREFKLDCEHTVKAGETFAVVSFFVCPDHAKWLKRVVFDYPFPELGEKR